MALDIKNMRSVSQSLVDSVKKVMEKSEPIPTYEQVLRDPSLANKEKKTVSESAVSDLVEGYKVGDHVYPKIGPHKGVKHEIIHVHEDGKLNIRPLGLRGNQIKYKLGAAGAQPDQVSSKP